MSSNDTPSTRDDFFPLFDERRAEVVAGVHAEHRELEGDQWRRLEAPLDRA